MTGPTGQSYTVRTLADILTIPADRRAVFMAELLQVLTELDSAMERQRREVGPKLAHHIDPNKLLGNFEWIDDGKGEHIAKLTGMGLDNDGQPIVVTDTIRFDTPNTKDQ